VSHQQALVQVELCCRREREVLLKSKGDFLVRHSNEIGLRIGMCVVFSHVEALMKDLRYEERERKGRVNERGEKPGGSCDSNPRKKGKSNPR